MAERQDQDQFDPRKALLQSLLRKVAEDPYPSTTMLDTIEELLTPDDVPGYAKVLLQHIEDDRFPSVPMIGRLRDLAV